MTIRKLEMAVITTLPMNALHLRCLTMDADARRTRHRALHGNEKYNDPARQAEALWSPIKSPKRTWSTAMKRIEKTMGQKWRWHNIRAACITHIAMTSGSLAAQTLARYVDFDMARDYIEVANQPTRDAAERATEHPALKVVSGGKSG